MWYNRKILCIPIWAVGIAVLAAAAGYAQQQAMQLTTYYPAPYGEYNEMKVKENLDIKKRLQALINPKLSPIEQRGVEINLADSLYQVKVSAIHDIDDPNYIIDPTTLTKVKQIQVDTKISLGEMEYSGWPIMAESSDKAAYPYSTPSISPNASANSMKVYYGTAQNTSKAAEVTITLPSPFINPQYFLGISPRQLSNRGGSLPDLPGHDHPAVDVGKKVKVFGVSFQIGFKITTHKASSKTYFTYYEIVRINKSNDSFKVIFRASDPSSGVACAIPTEFDWIAIGY